MIREKILLDRMRAMHKEVKKDILKEVGEMLIEEGKNQDTMIKKYIEWKIQEELKKYKIPS